MQSKLWDDLIIADEYMGKVCRIALGHVVACDSWMKWYSEELTIRFELLSLDQVSCLNWDSLFIPIPAIAS